LAGTIRAERTEATEFAVLPTAVLADGVTVVTEPGLGVAESLVVGVESGAGVGSVVGVGDIGGLVLGGTDGLVLVDIVGVGVALPVFDVLGDLHAADAEAETDGPAVVPGALGPWLSGLAEVARPPLPDPPPDPEW
jgi:hypothetical protein